MKIGDELRDARHFMLWELGMVRSQSAAEMRYEVITCARQLAREVVTMAIARPILIGHRTILP